jgi:hypothetical protein
VATGVATGISVANGVATGTWVATGAATEGEAVRLSVGFGAPPPVGRTSWVGDGDVFCTEMQP